MYKLLGPMVILLLLYLWKIAYPVTCLAWSVPIAIWALIVHGQFQQIMFFKVHRAKLLFNSSSCVFRFMIRKPLTAIVTSLVMFPIVFSLFLTLTVASLSDWGFMIATAFLAALLYFCIGHTIRKHTNKYAQDIIIKKAAIIISFGIITTAYIYLSYFSLPISNYINPDDLIQSKCVVTDSLVEIYQEFQYTILSVLVIFSKNTDNFLLQFVPWFLYFLKSAMIFFTVSSGTIEVIFQMEQNLPIRRLDNNDEQ